MTYVITVSNEKGGVAKTTTTLSLGAALAEKGYQILLIDLDAQANLTLALGFEPGGAALTSSDILLENIPLENVWQKSDVERLDLVPSSQKMERAEQLLPIHLNYSTRLADAIQASHPTKYDFLLIDCPPALGAVTLNALNASDLLIVPTQAEYFSAYALRNMMTLVRKVRSENNPPLAYRILITMLDRRNRSHRTIQAQLENTFGDGLFKSIIEIDTKLRESPILGLPITKYKSNTRGSEQYRLLAQELVEYVKETNQQPT
ncbi:MAG: ParA family protein [Anaerolineales bacterium]|uniref:ParA family protein n=1 Tax=Candidatus Desulfolinea nitratireducens TaxID=2841698 RepID=A0A8J6NGX0_9CHLR|nr:ParA family protein [Candidatus Desulfolinea nitratireducens]MBL6959765.1 ParA family protein [Anaerolineales bacterium]